MPLDPAMQYKQFPLRRMALTRSEDVNAARHVAAIALSTILENERTAMLLDRLGYDVDGAEGCSLVYIETSFLREQHHPATLEVATGIAAIGRTSFTFGQVIFHEGACVSLALANYVNVTTSGAAPINEVRRAALTANLIA